MLPSAHPASSAMALVVAPASPPPRITPSPASMMCSLIPFPGGPPPPSPLSPLLVDPVERPGHRRHVPGLALVADQGGQLGLAAAQEVGRLGEGPVSGLADLDAAAEPFDQGPLQLPGHRHRDPLGQDRPAGV